MLYFSRRCMYQLKIWYSSDIPTPVINTDDSGWILTDDAWSPVYSDDKPIPSFVRKALSIYCSDKNCDNRKCACLKEGLKCCTECKCRSCSNIIRDFETDTDEMYEFECY